MLSEQQCAVRSAMSLPGTKHKAHLRVQVLILHVLRPGPTPWREHEAGVAASLRTSCRRKRDL